MNTKGKERKMRLFHLVYKGKATDLPEIITEIEITSFMRWEEMLIRTKEIGRLTK